jgi:hypothetical protein
MRRPNLIPLDRTMRLPLLLAGGLRTAFADVVGSPIPGKLAALVRRLDDGHGSGKERDGESEAKKSSHINRRGRC